MIATPFLLAALLAAPQAGPALAPGAIRAQYDWGYASAEGSGKGTLAVLIEPATGRVVMELHGVGERLMLLTGDRATGYRVQIPREELDQQAASLGALPLPFLPQVGSPEALLSLLKEGKGPGVKASRIDKDGPRNLTATGKDRNAKEYTVWLKRSRWELGS